VHQLLNSHSNDIALIIGNGINRYSKNRNIESWEGLLEELARKYNFLPNTPADANFTDLIKGISLTEFFDVLDMKASKTSKETNLQREFCELMAKWTPDQHHKWITQWAQAHNTPVLTTNFENTLGQSIDCTLRRIEHNPKNKEKGFTDYYPWSSYYSTTDLSNPIDGFGVWHINGMEHYARSIRLGLTHYMGSVERSRNWFHKGNDARLFSGKNVDQWKGHSTWLNIVFSKPLLIFGLALEENEVFLRWLLLERARYFKKFPERKKEAWFVHLNNKKPRQGKLLFLSGVGVDLFAVDNYDQIYGAETWSLGAQ